ncbi:MAG: hypothetical protein JWM80_4358 [Cyanobacteria bacterium RYN_339]|nr:hypothetical protein [Cyanobacteria bacterium RYN_339]
MPTNATLRLNLPRAFALAAATVGFLAAAALPAAAQNIVEMRDGRKIEGERIIYTYTNVVVITPGNNLEVLANGDVKAIDGKPFSQAYWADKPVNVESIDGVAPVPGAGVGGAWPVQYGTVRRYNLAKQTTTWVRHGDEMERRTTVTGTGDVMESVTGMPKQGRVVVTETITEKEPGKARREVRLTDQIEPRPDGYYLMGQILEDESLRVPRQEDRITTPPRLWPNVLTIGQTWIVGPFQRLGVNQVGRMEVVGRESVTVPAGTYPDAFKITGHSHVFAGTQLLKAGRLVTDHGTLETTTWFVPGLGPVREEAKLHMHQSYFPTTPKGAEVPLVVEEVSTRSLSEFQLGR